MCKKMIRGSFRFFTLCRKNFKIQIQYLIKPVAAVDTVLTFWQNTSDEKGLFFF